MYACTRQASNGMIAACLCRSRIIGNEALNIETSDRALEYESGSHPYQTRQFPGALKSGIIRSYKL